MRCRMTWRSSTSWARRDGRWTTTWWPLCSASRVTTSRSTPDTARWAAPPGLLDGTPAGVVAALLAVLAVCAAHVHGHWLPPSSLRVVTVAVVHGGRLTIAFGWAATSPSQWTPLGPSVIIILVLVGAAAGARWDPRAAIFCLASPLWLTFMTINGRLDALGLRWPIPVGGSWLS